MKVFLNLPAIVASLISSSGFSVPRLILATWLAIFAVPYSVTFDVVEVTQVGGGGKNHSSAVRQIVRFLWNQSTGRSRTGSSFTIPSPISMISPFSERIFTIDLQVCGTGNNYDFMSMVYWFTSAHTNSECDRFVPFLDTELKSERRTNVYFSHIFHLKRHMYLNASIVKQTMHSYNISPNRAQKKRGQTVVDVFHAAFMRPINDSETPYTRNSQLSNVMHGFGCPTTSDCPPQNVFNPFLLPSMFQHAASTTTIPHKLEWLSSSWVFMNHSRKRWIVLTSGANAKAKECSRPRS